MSTGLGGEDHLDYEHRVASTEAERQALATAKLALNDAQNEFFASFGVNRANVESMEDFKENLRMMRELRKRPELWQDLDFLHAARSGVGKAGSRFILTIITLFAGAFAYGMVEWVKGVLSGRQ